MSVSTEQSIHDYLGQQASDVLAGLYPHRKQETWRHTSLERIPTLKKGSTSNRDSLNHKIYDSYIIISDNNIISSENVDFTESNEELDLIEKLDYFSNVNRIAKNKTITLNIEQDCESEIEIIYNTSSAHIHTPKLIINCGKHSRLNLIERYLSDESAISASNTVINLEQNSKCQHIKLYEKAENAFASTQTESNLNRDAHYELVAINTKATLIRNHVTSNLLAENSTTIINGAFILNNDYQADNYSQINHKAAHTYSHQLYKSLLDDQAQAVFNGNIYVHQDAQQINSEQLNKNLLLSSKARVFAQPQLNISADDVKCAHGATIGKMDDEELFYLQSRGINADRAKHLLTQAFVSDVLDNLVNTKMHKYAVNHIAETLKDFASLKDEAHE
jgi:Fe-S cluster assembly protein SufD